jgi:hypothetical protein
MRKYLFLFLFFSISLNYSQDRKEIEVKDLNPPVIDGILDDLQWKILYPAKNFERWMPNNGSKKKKGYENFSLHGSTMIHIYIAGKFNNPNPFLLNLVKEIIFGK